MCYFGDRIWISWATITCKVLKKKQINKKTSGHYSPLTDTLVSGQLYLWTLFSILLLTFFSLFLLGIILVSGQLYYQTLFPIPKGVRSQES